MIPNEPAFTNDEYAGRRQTVQAALASVGADAVILFDPHNINYLCGMDSENWFDTQSLIVPSHGRPTLVALDFEKGRFENSATECTVQFYTADQDPIECVIATVKSLGLGSGRLRLHMRAWTSAWAFQQIMSGLPDAQISDGFGFVERARLRKSPTELAYMGEAARLTDAGIRAGLAAVGEGVSDSEVAGAIVQAMYAAGSDSVCWGPVVAAGYRAGAAHSSFNGYRVRSGDTVFLEVTGEKARYVSPLMRTAVVGQPSKRMREVESAVSCALDAMVAAARPGAPASHVASAGERELRPILGDLTFHFNFGYPVGLGYPPTWIEQLGFFLRHDNGLPLEAGMAFHLPLSLRKYGEFAVNLSLAIVIESNGARPFTSLQPALHIASS